MAIEFGKDNNGTGKMEPKLVSRASVNRGARGIRQMTELHRLSIDELRKHNIIYQGMANPAALNTFRDLRARLIQKAVADNFVVMVASAIKSGGASHVSLNLAAAFALDHSKTSVLVDCDLKAPSVHKLLPVTPDYGLADYLEDGSLSADAIIYSSGIDRLRLVPAGSPRETGPELLNSESMREFVEELKKRYPDRCIILDAPSVDVFGDARVLAEYCDLALLVVPYGKVTQDQVVYGIDAVGRNKLAGLVFNN